MIQRNWYAFPPFFKVMNCQKEIKKKVRNMDTRKTVNIPLRLSNIILACSQDANFCSRNEIRLRY